MKQAVWDQFKAMGTDVIIFLVASETISAQNDIESVKLRIKNFEKRFSRFLKDNELYKLNNCESESFYASAEMLDLLKKSKEMHELTNGIFDPTVVRSLEVYGYDKSLDFSGKEIRENTKIDTEILRSEFLKRARFGDLLLGENNDVRISKGLKIDFGGIGKGYIMDIIASIISQKYENFWISAGGDMFLSGNDANGESWKIGVQNPLDLASDLKTLDAKGKNIAVATSGITKRKGMNGSVEWNHIIDPRTGLSVKNNLLAVTVISDKVYKSDVFAKTALILGEKEGIDFINKQESAECVAIDKDLNFYFSKNAKEYFV